LKAGAKREMEKASSIGMIILFLLLLILLIKYFVKRYMSDNDRFYTINKALNVTFGTLLIITLLFSYIENVDYLVTILGFASAGIAIAMKDWFMSILGWFVIIIGGAIHVGDRVKFVRQGMEYVGDIVDISLLRMTIQEDITLTSYMHNRRAGRIIFVPNNYVFTDMIANYSHAGLKTVWDGIDFMITFDSNVSKAASIAKEVTKKYSKGYTEITRKQLNKLRSQYSMKNTNVEPRIYTFIEPYGIKISAWYHTNAYATLTLRSTISMEIIERLQAEEDISLAFPTQSIYIDKDVRKPSLQTGSLFSEGE
jgi:small-conductance mechanosensitive channel